MKKSFKFISRLLVSVLLLIFAVCTFSTLFTTIVVPKLPIVRGAEFAQDVSGTMSEPDKTYAKNALREASEKYKIATVLDYQLTSFDTNESYVDKIVSSVIDNVYINQKYVVYTYFKDSQTLIISTNIYGEDNKEKSIKKDDIDNDAKVVKEILYFQQNLEPQYGLKNWNFKLNPTYAKNACIQLGETILAVILAIGVFPSENFSGFSNRRSKRSSNHAASE